MLFSVFFFVIENFHSRIFCSNNRNNNENNNNKIIAARRCEARQATNLGFLDPVLVKYKESIWFF